MVLILDRKKLTKPTGGPVEIDWSHPLARGLEFYPWIDPTMGPQVRDLAAGVSGIVASGAIYSRANTDENGRYYQGGAEYSNNNWVDFGTSIDPRGWAGITASVKLRHFFGTTGRYPGVLANVRSGEFFGNFLLQQEWDTNIRSMSWRTGTSPTVVCQDRRPEAYSTGDVVRWTGTWDKVTSYLYSGTTQRATVANAGDWDTSNYVTNLGYYSRNGTRTFGGRVYDAAIWSRALSPAEIAHYDAEPYDMLRQVTRRSFYFPTGGGGTITGTASGLLEALAGSASGSFTPLAITGTASAALEAVAAAASGDFTPSGVTGTASATLAMFEADASGAYTPMLVSGSAAAILDPLSADAAGTFFGLFTGTGAADIAALTADVTGSFAAAGTFSGSGAAAITAISGAASGTFYGAFTGTASGTLEPVTAAGSGSFLAAITGGGAAVIAQIEATADGWITITGTGAATFAPLTGYGLGTFTRLSVTVGRIQYAYAARSRRTATATPHIFTSTARH